MNNEENDNNKVIEKENYIINKESINLNIENNINNQNNESEKYEYRNEINIAYSS